jgi:hypothetical protein
VYTRLRSFELLATRRVLQAKQVGVFVKWVAIPHSSGLLHQQCNSALNRIVLSGNALQRVDLPDVGCE